MLSINYFWGKKMTKEYLFTSESVSEGHPDKVCDIISDSIVDDFLSQENPENARVAMETLVTTNKVVIAGEVRGPEGYNCDYEELASCLLYTSPSPRDQRGSRMPSSA